MHVLVVGSGVIGAETVGQFAKYTDADISVADIDNEKAEDIAVSFTNQHIAVEQIDVSDPENIRNSIKAIDPDIIANTVGPFYKYAENVYQACLETGIGCVDVCDDIEGAEAALSVHEDAKEEGITIVTGAGDSPGLTNIIAKHGANQLEEVSSIDIYWVAPQSDIGTAQFYHAIEMFAHPRAYLDGELTETHGMKEVEFKPPLGTINLTFTDHPEVYTLPEYIDGLTQVRNAGALYPKLPISGEEIGELYRRLTESTEKQGRANTIQDAFVGLLSETRKQMLERWDSQGIEYNRGGTRIEVKGRNEGSKAEYIFSSVGQGMSSTPRTLVTVTKMVANNDVPKGAYAPEGCIDPDIFIQEFSGGQLGFEQTPQSFEIRLAEKQVETRE